MATILVIDDDPHLRDVLRVALTRGGFEVHEAPDGACGLAAAAAATPDCVLLDVVMPGLDGLEVCRRLRERSSVPIIFLTSVDDEADRVVGLELGADDYVVKPFSPREVVARVRAVLRRSSPSGSARPLNNEAATGVDPPVDRVLRHGSLSANRERYSLARDGREVTLSAVEFALVLALLRRPGKIFTRDELLDAAYADGTVVSDRTIDTHVRRIRQKCLTLDCNPIATVHGLGYRLGDV